MHDGVNIINTIKQCALEAVEATQPSNFMLGKVVSISPLSILIDQKLTLGEGQLIKCRNVSDYQTSVSISWNTSKNNDNHTHTVIGNDGNGDSIDLTSSANSVSHMHDISGTKNITIHNGLKVGEDVILIKQSGGQKYLILDRVAK